ncbi:MAG: tRNA 2-thiocytidine(32) synthetase TtcA [Myxococcales bacterium]|nr:tRNA 2-thiocytidine(32) synthetase TtcA [Myxococcales bacterium]USN49940.1 MAG: tRNA 2-thiocytidine(32) synthetase TtcA [Myxococcales bacterium]
MNERAPNERHWAGFAVSQQTSLRRKRLMRTMLNTVVDYQLIEENDHIMVAISGGKDSYTLLDLLLSAQARAPFSFKVTAVHVDQVQPGYDGKPLENWLMEHNIDHEIIREDTYSVVKEKTKPGGTYCSLCSRMRRGVLYKVASRIKANKIALGHHRDDAIETLLLNLIYAGKLQAMPPKYRTDDGQFFVIRPLIEVAERDIISYAKQKEFPILPCNLCGSQEGLKRKRMKELLDSLEQEKSDVRSVMLHAIKNVKASHLLDPRYLDGEKIFDERASKRLKVIG